jgi:hypothetical protein
MNILSLADQGAVERKEFLPLKHSLDRTLKQQLVLISDPSHVHQSSGKATSYHNAQLIK